MVGRYQAHTVGAQASQLALAVAPPPPPRKPRRMPSAGEIMLFVVPGLPGAALFVAALISPGAPSIWDRVAWAAFSLIWVAIPVLVLVFGQRRRRRRQASYLTYRRIFPAAVRAWWAVMLCVRCCVAFVPAGTVPDVTAAGGLIPLSGFGPAILAIATEVTDLATGTEVTDLSTGSDEATAAAIVNKSVSP